MCGIAGYVDFHGDPVSLDILGSMAQSLAHRGPDDAGVAIDGRCGFSHRRLSVIDVEGSPQPMHVKGSPILLTYNGELYNYRELRSELSRHEVSFETRGDTEVVLRWVDSKWKSALRRFDGMFAFGAWHGETECLLLARDPMGIKPLFYALPAPGLLIFGSEIKAVLRHPQVKKELNLPAMREALRYRAVYGARSLYTGVQQLEPGCFLEFDRRGLRIGRYWDLASEVRRVSADLRGLTTDQVIEHGRHLFAEAVEKRLVADVPVGAFLSGGVDSSLIVGQMRALRDAGEEVCTFSVGFRGDENSELGYAKLAAEAIGTKHTEVPIAEDDYIAAIRPMTAARDAPLSEPADLAIAQMSRVAREAVKVVLTGEGSDEVFAGYPKYLLSRAPWILRAGARAVGPLAAQRLASTIGLDARRVGTAVRSLGQPREIDRLAQWFSYLDRFGLQSLLPGLGWSDSEWEDTLTSQLGAMRRFEDMGAMTRMQGVDCLTWLPGNLLERGDRMSMSAGLEARVPFLDRSLVPYGLALDDRYKVRGRTLKWLVRRWASHLVPVEIARRPKWGFRVPLERWFRGSLREMLHDYLLASDGVCGSFGDRRAMGRLLEAHQVGIEDASWALWTLLSTEVWYQNIFLEGTRA